MKQRTGNPRCRAYPNYGGRGITMTSEWDKFEPFLEWALANGWQDGLDLDRIDNDGPYCADNCRWTTRRENTNNRRKTIKLTVDGETKAASIWSDELGIPRCTIRAWCLKHGYPYAESMLKEAKEHGYRSRWYSHGNTKPVIHVESGRRFQSVHDAASAFGISACNLSVKLNRNQGLTKFGTFQFIDNLS